MNRDYQLGLIDPTGDHLKTLLNCGGYYLCPPGPDGLLVGYAGTYENPILGEEPLHKVGRA